MNYKKFLNVVGVSAVAVVFCVGCNQDDDPPADPNDGKGDDSYIYSGGSVTIGTQTWMAENLNRATTNSTCYNNNADSCAKYGRLYTWGAAKIACPSGWRLPTDAEWTALTGAVGGEWVAGEKLKATSGWYNGWNNNGNGTDEYGFSALPGGFGYSGGDFSYAGSLGYWWSSTDNDASGAWNRYMDAVHENVYRSGDYGEAFMFSVRCVQD